MRKTMLLLLLSSVACGREDVPAPAAAEAAMATGQRLMEVTFPDGPVGESARRGLAILEATRDSLPAYVGNDLRCTSCHLDQGTRANAIPWVGIQARFPQYNTRAAAVFRLEERVNGCLERSMNGSPLPLDHPAMRDIVAYFAVLSRDVPVGTTISGQGLLKPEMAPGDTVHGAEVWLQQCARCHSPDGSGSELGPPVWGDRSFNIGAGMARLRTAAGFIRHNMPFDRPGTLTDAEALDVAAYVITRPRPDFARKAGDWPKGDPPVDVAYPTTAGRRDGGER